MKETPGFESSIRQQFADIIADFGFDVQYDKASRSNKLQLINHKCIVRFIYDMGAIQCDFIDPIEKARRESVPRPDGLPSDFPVYPAWSVWKFLYPHDPENFSSGLGKVEEQVASAKRLVSQRLTNILNGNFSWTTDYNINSARLRQKIQFMMTHWPQDNPVRVQFRHGDPCWEKAFDEHKAFLESLLGRRRL